MSNVLFATSTSIRGLATSFRGTPATSEASAAKIFQSVGRDLPEPVQHVLRRMSAAGRHATRCICQSFLRWAKGAVSGYARPDNYTPACPRVRDIARKKGKTS
jgi:hypothetical protein